MLGFFVDKRVEKMFKAMCFELKIPFQHRKCKETLSQPVFSAWLNRRDEKARKNPFAKKRFELYAENETFLSELNKILLEERETSTGERHNILNIALHKLAGKLGLSPYQSTYALQGPPDEVAEMRATFQATPSASQYKDMGGEIHKNIQETLNHPAWKAFKRNLERSEVTAWFTNRVDQLQIGPLLWFVFDPDVEARAFLTEFMQWLVDQNETATGKRETLLEAAILELHAKTGLGIPNPTGAPAPGPAPASSNGAWFNAAASPPPPPPTPKRSSAGLFSADFMQWLADHLEAAPRATAADEQFAEMLENAIVDLCDKTGLPVPETASPPPDKPQIPNKITGMINTYIHPTTTKPMRDAAFQALSRIASK